ncbi:hypothetical protein FGIG_12173 [Fasciola gigantica]|uniref:CUB domain-containing protein n=1 Tax=Fasciola gigantica TaxID=46835 RepID=A0A504YFY7_FASGI|nr:hypothetical protein FGIG_12173 [Fasciola gigantica]
MLQCVTESYSLICKLVWGTHLVENTKTLLCIILTRSFVLVFRPHTVERRPTLVPSCGYIVRNAFGSIHSHSYPEPFPNGMNCMWMITPKKNKFIRFTLKDFQLDEEEHTTNIFEVWTLVGQRVLRLKPMTISLLKKSKYMLGPLIFKFVHNRKLKAGRFRIDYETSEFEIL